MGQKYKIINTDGVEIDHDLFVQDLIKFLNTTAPYIDMSSDVSTIVIKNTDANSHVIEEEITGNPILSYDTATGVKEVILNSAYKPVGFSLQEYANLAAFPVTGIVNTLYVAIDTELTYRWDGAAYSEVSPSPAAASKLSWGFTGTVNADNKNLQDMQLGDVFTNETPFIVPVACELKRITLASDGVETWTVDILKNDVSVSTLASGGAASAVSGSLSVAFAAGDRVRIVKLASANNIKMPRATAFFQET